MAAKVLIVKVTQEHIDTASSRYPASKHCPLAIACGGRVGIMYATVGGTHYILTDKAKRFARIFDNGGLVKPATFRLKATATL